MGAIDAGDVRRKLAVLRRHCDDLGRAYDSILRTMLTGWLILADDDALLTAKVDRYFPDGVDARFSGPRRGFVVAATPDRAIAYYRDLVAAGIQYFVVQVMDAADIETIRLLAEKIVPAVQSGRRS